MVFVGCVLDCKNFIAATTSILLCSFSLIGGLFVLHHDYKSCVSISNDAFYFQTGRLTLQSCIPFTIVAFHLLNVEVRFTIKLSVFMLTDIV